MSERYKNLVEQIQKMAQVPGRSRGDRVPPAPAPAAPGGDAAPAPTGDAGVPTRGARPEGDTPVARPAGDSNVMKMQKAMIALAREVTVQLNLKNLTSGNPRQQTEAGGRDSFGDFLTKHFMRNSNIPAVEFNPDPAKSKVEDKDPRMASKMSWVMDTMARIGGATNEFAVDGRWGPRTSAALDNIAAFANGLFALSEAFDVHSRYYNRDELRDLETVAENQDDMDAATKSHNAGVMANHINAIRKFYADIKNQVLQLPQYQTYIEQDTPYLQHEKSEGFTPTPDQLAQMKKLFPNGFNISQGTTENGTQVSARLMVDDLSSPEKLTNWTQSRGNGDPSEVLQQVLQQLNQMERS